MTDFSEIKNLAEKAKAVTNPIKETKKTVKKSVTDTAKSTVGNRIKKSDLIDKETQDTFKDIGSYFKDLGDALKK